MNTLADPKIPLSSGKRMAILIAFVLSGCAGLIYQSTWSHYLGLFMGHAAYAQSLTLTIFMGGMGIGAWLVAKKIKNIHNALLIYALAEFVLGMAGLFFHSGYVFVTDFSYDTAIPALQDPLLVGVYKWLVSGLIILPQAILLGATFPLLSSGLIRRTGSGSGSNLSILYFTNSIGAAFGALITTFMLLPLVGMPGSILTAALLNVLVAIMVYYSAKHPENNYQVDKKTDDQSNAKLYRLILIAAAITGATSFAYEIAWVRMLNLLFGTTLHSFELMLSAFIAGIAFGGLWVKKRIDKYRELLTIAGYAQIAMGLMAILTLPLYIQSFDWLAYLLNYVLKETSEGYIFYNLITSLTAAMIMIPATFFAGMTLPLYTSYLLRNQHSEKTIGNTYAANTIGSVIGIWLAMHIGFEMLGLKSLILVSATIDILLGLYLLMINRQVIKFASFTIVSLVIVLYVILQVRFDPAILSSGTYRYARSNLYDKESEKTSKVEYYVDGTSASVSIIKQQRSEDVYGLSILTNGKPDAAIYYNSPQSSTDEITMVMLGALPLVMKPEAQHVGIIGFGSGLTTHTVLASPLVERVDTVEIEPRMIEGARLFLPRTERAYNDPRSQLVIDDARSYFTSSQNNYDVIISEPSNPWLIGVSNLFSDSFYRLSKRHLKPDGLLVQWVHLYEISPEVLATIVNALNAEYEYYHVYFTALTDILIVASQQPLNDEYFKTRSFSELPVLLQQELASVDISSYEQISSRYVGDKALIAPLFEIMRPEKNTDYLPILSIEAPKDRFAKRNSFRLSSVKGVNVPWYMLVDPDRERLVSSSNDLEVGHIRKNPLKNVEGVLKDYHSYAAGTVGETRLPINIVWRIKNPALYCGLTKTEEIQWVQSLIKFASILYQDSKSESARLMLEDKDVAQCLKQLKSPAVRLFVELVLAITAENWQQAITISEQLMASHRSEIVDIHQDFYVQAALFARVMNKSVLSFKFNDELQKKPSLIDEDSTMHVKWLYALLVTFYGM